MRRNEVNKIKPPDNMPKINTETTQGEVKKVKQPI